MNNGFKNSPTGSGAGWNLPWTGLTRALLLGTALLAYLRLFIGVDVTDEAFYNSLPYSFVLGFRPYRDELNITQNAGILLTPVVKVYCSAVGSAAGLVLFNRHLYFMLLSACSYLAFRVGAGHLGRDFGRMLAAFVLTFSYFNIPSLSYNTLGAFFLFLGLFQLLLYSIPDDLARRPRLILGANLCLILSAFGYPTMLLSSLAGLGSSWWLLWRNNAEGPDRATREDRIAWGASLAVGAAGALAFVAWFGLDSIRDSLAYASSYSYNLAETAPRMVQIVLGQLRHLSWYLAGFSALLFLPALPSGVFAKFRLSFFCAVVAGSGALLYLVHRQPSLAVYPAGSTPLLLACGILLLPVLGLLQDRHLVRELAVVIGLPCFVSAAAISFSSTNGLPSATLGLFPAAVCTLLGVGVIARSIDRNEVSNGMRLTSLMGVMVPLLVFQVWCLLERSYRDAPFAPGAGPAWASGPFAGMLTTDTNARRLVAVAADLNSLGDHARTVFIYDRFPAGYLLSRLKPRTFSTWILWPEDAAVRARLLRRVFASSEAPPDAILQIGPRPAWVDAEVQRLKYRVYRESREFDYILLLREHD